MAGRKMTVGELIELLEEMPADSEVGFAYDYGDHCHATVVQPVQEVVEEEIMHSEYHRMDMIPRDPTNKVTTRKAVILK